MVRAMGQARRAEGVISVSGDQVDGVYHTLSVWRAEAAMRDYLTSGAYLQAMKAYRSIGQDRTYGFATTKAPAWPQALSLWREKGRTV